MYVVLSNNYTSTISEYNQSIFELIFLIRVGRQLSATVLQPPPRLFRQPEKVSDGQLPGRAGVRAGARLCCGRAGLCLVSRQA